MAQGRKTIEELIAEEERKAGQAKVRVAELRTRQRVEERKRDSHRKIVVGAGAIAHIRIDPQFRQALRDALNKAVTDPKQRAVIPDLLDEQAFQESLRAAAKRAESEAKEVKEAGQGSTEPAAAVRPQGRGGPPSGKLRPA